MGWKAIKEYYQIKHYVSLYDGEGICIGSPYVHDLITINPETGKLKPSIIFDPGKEDDDLNRYWNDLSADPNKLLELIKQEDIFETSIPVYTYEGSEILEKFCEKPGWPNVTHDGYIMYENTFSTDKNKVIQWAKTEAAYSIKHFSQRVKEVESDLIKFRSFLSQAKADIKNLKLKYPKL